MKIKIKELNNVRKQELKIEKNFTLIYGLNESGKSSVIESIYSHFAKFHYESEFMPFNIIRSIRFSDTQTGVKTKNIQLVDEEDYINFIDTKKLDVTSYYESLRNHYLSNNTIYQDLISILDNLFELGDKIDFNHRYSDGVENIINLYLEIIFALGWQVELERIKDIDSLNQLKNGKAVILIDEVENYLHLSVQQKLLNWLEREFPNVKFIVTTHSVILLTRKKSIKCFQIKNGRLFENKEDMYYRDLDFAMEETFEVAKFPKEYIEFLEYFDKVMSKEIKGEKKVVEAYLSYIEKQFPNIYRNNIILLEKLKAII